MSAPRGRRGRRGAKPSCGGDTPRVCVIGCAPPPSAVAGPRTGTGGPTLRGSLSPTHRPRRGLETTPIRCADLDRYGENVVGPASRWRTTSSRTWRVSHTATRSRSPRAAPEGASEACLAHLRRTRGGAGRVPCPPAQGTGQTGRPTRRCSAPTQGSGTGKARELHTCAGRGPTGPALRPRRGRRPCRPRRADPGPGGSSAARGRAPRRRRTPAP